MLGDAPVQVMLERAPCFRGIEGGLHRAQWRSERHVRLLAAVSETLQRDRYATLRGSGVQDED
jgi:hypothetical protein